MLTFNETVTVYNSRFNSGTGFDDYFRTVVTRCSWYSRLKAAAGPAGLVYDRLFHVRMLDGRAEAGKQYAAPEAYTDPDTQFTLAPGAILCRGEGPPAPAGGKELATLLRRPDTFKALDCRDNRRAGAGHLYVEGK